MTSLFGTRLSFRNIKLRTALVLPVIAGVPMALSGLFPAVAAADSANITFESPGYSTGVINGQNFAGAQQALSRCELWKYTAI